MLNLKSNLIKFEDTIANEHKYISLWRAVILQAILDIKSKSKDYKDSINKTKAIQWINMNRKDFIRVCQMADFDPQSIYDYKEKLLKRQDASKTYNK